MKQIRMAWYVTAFAVLRLVPHPRWRAWVIRLLGAKIGQGVRVHSCKFINHELGFSNLAIGSGVYLGPDCLLDLAGPLQIGDRATVSARCVLMTHSDPGASHGNALSHRFPPSRLGCRIGADAWVGVGAVMLQGSDVGARSIVGAASLVLGPLPADSVCFGQPARSMRSLLPD